MYRKIDAVPSVLELYRQSLLKTALIIEGEITGKHGSQPRLCSHALSVAISERCNNLLTKAFTDSQTNKDKVSLLVACLPNEVGAATMASRRENSR